MTNKRNRRLFPFAAAAAALLLAACGPRAAEKGPLDGAAIGGPFTLSDSAGKPVSWADFGGKYRIVYFGYTYCPDVCPTDMGRIARGYAAFKAEHPEQAAQVVPIFITVDPERDTAAKVGEFTHAFSDDIVGLTGTPAQVAAAVKEFKIYVEKGKPNAQGAYLVNHSNAAYLMGRKGEPIALLPIDVKDQGQAIAAGLDRWIK
ncbi:MAG: SCO family protein [Candidatus Andeanibacterium colombiense]|uniref:SCO family protein n=1 Tax=Candidatus Andeanibacterium colombiense TaxID=3121345 RepID=A0AAJ5X8F6_9SPHN|nr:MAG: SCO family protein [Sphingomonadaceae bacterium]